jgi:hypothetical protein
MPEMSTVPLCHDRRLARGSWEGLMLTEHRFHTGVVMLNYAEAEAWGPPLVLIHGGLARWQSALHLGLLNKGQSLSHALRKMWRIGVVQIRLDLHLAEQIVRLHKFGNLA